MGRAAIKVEQEGYLTGRTALKNGQEDDQTTPETILEVDQTSAQIGRGPDGWNYRLESCSCSVGPESRSWLAGLKSWGWETDR